MAPAQNSQSRSRPASQPSSESTQEDAIQALREKVALSCRILAMLGIVSEITGHVSARVPGSTSEMLLRCRGDDEYGLPFTTADAIRRLDFDGNGEGLGPSHAKPVELPIHGETFKARPSVNCVIHAHPPGVLLCTVGGVDLKPVFGAFDPSAMRLALNGLPVYPRSVTLIRPNLVWPMLALMGDRPVCLMYGHGLTAVGRTVEEATLNVIRVEKLARICWHLSRRGELAELPWEDIEEFTRRGPSPEVPRGDEWAWRYYVRVLEEGRGVPGLLPAI